MASSIITLQGRHSPRRVDDLPGFTPQVIDRDYLQALGVGVVPARETVAALTRGSRLFAARLRRGVLLPRHRITTGRIELEHELEIHNYTGSCPTSTYELNPLVGCHVGCLYCLVSDGLHEQELLLYENYPAYVERILARKLGERCFYYFSPKTEALQEPTLQTGIAHDILRVFIRHFARHPRSPARLFIASKAGAAQLRARHEGESILELFTQLRGRMQFNTSLSIMPPALQEILEPHAAPLAERLAAVRLCQEHDVLASSALVQPIIIPSLTETVCDDFFASLASHGIINYKPEFLTLCPENLAVIGQLLGYFDKAQERRLYDIYLAPENRDHTKQRERTAPERAVSVAALHELIEASRRHGITTSICAWVRRELAIPERLVPSVNQHGFRCLGYQTRLLDERAGAGAGE